VDQKCFGDMKPPVTAATRLLGVAGFPIAHSLSPVFFGAWIDRASLDAVYLAFAPAPGRFAQFVDGLRGVILGLNVTAPFKEEALALADRATDRARRSGAANLLVFETEGAISADNTDGLGLMGALRTARGGFEPASGPAVIFGAGGAARGAAASLLEAGVPEVRIVCRSRESGLGLASHLGVGVRIYPLENSAEALAGSMLIVHATPQGQDGGAAPPIPLEAAPNTALVMDMVYRPPLTALLDRAAGLGHPTVDGLAMLIGQAIPSFETLFGEQPPAVDVRALALQAMAHQ
jgi:shikimate dehydrogenase